MKRILLDTNPLVLWIVGNLDSSRIGARRLEAFEYDHLTILNEIEERLNKHVSTPNILTEASDLIGSGHQQLCKNGAKALGLFIEQLDEIYIPSITSVPLITK